MLFEQERFAFTKIQNVVRYAPRTALRYTYPGTLPTYELMYYEYGDTTLTFHGRTFHMTAGSVLYLPKGIPDNRYEVSVTEEFSLYNIYFDTDDPMPCEPVLITPGNDEFRALFEKLFHLWIGKRSGYYYKAMEQAYHLVYALRRAQERYTLHGAQGRLANVEEYLAEHYCDTRFDYAAMASVTGLSYSYFKKLFVDTYGCPPVKQVMRLKLSRARELLQTGRFRVSEVAELCGFENVYYFSTAFKKHVGISPKQYVDVVSKGDQP